MDNLTRNIGSPMTLVWPWWKAEEAGRGKHTDTTKTSFRNVPVLPLEIVDNILREACGEWPLGGTERQMLTVCTLVCKSWLPLVQSLLYLHLIVETRHASAPRNPGTIGSEALLQQSHLLAFTRLLSIRVMGRTPETVQLLSDDDDPEGSQESAQIPDFFFLLAHTPRLRFLDLSIYKNIGPFEPHVLDWLSSLVLPVEALDFNDSGHFNSTFYDLVGVWPTIQALRMRTLFKGLPSEMPSISISLRELRLPIISVARRIKWLLPPPPPNEPSSLCFLELYGISEEVLPVLSVHGPSVSTLTLARQPVVEFAHLFTKLEELVIVGPYWRNPLPAFPRTLKHIRLRDSGHIFKTPLPAIAQVVPMLPDLRVLSIDKALTAAHLGYPDLQKACETHKVEILVHSVNSSGRTVHPYHVEMDRFPRQYTFSEFFESKTLKGSSTL